MKMSLQWTVSIFRRYVKMNNRTTNGKKSIESNWPKTTTSKYILTAFNLCNRRLLYFYCHQFAWSFLISIIWTPWKFSKYLLLFELLVDVFSEAVILILKHWTKRIRTLNMWSSWLRYATNLMWLFEMFQSRAKF